MSVPMTLSSDLERQGVRVNFFFYSGSPLMTKLGVVTQMAEKRVS